MHFLCKCGYSIHDTSDNLSYKANIIADQDMDEFWNLIEEAEKPHNETKAIFHKLTDLMIRCIYQCPLCGRLYIEDQDNDFRFICFSPCSEGEPDSDVSKKLLRSKYGDKWKGYLYADWYDKKPDWCEYHGMIWPMVNIQLDDLEFNDREAFEKRFYELLEHMKALDLIYSATLNINGKRTTVWKRRSEEK